MIWLNGFEFMYILVFLIIVVSIISQIIRGVGQWNKNNQKMYFILVNTSR